MLTLGEVLRLSAVKRPDNDAIIYPKKDQYWNYREFNNIVNQLAHGLSELGISKGDRVSVILHNTSELLTTYFATAKIGAIFNPLNYRLKKDEINYIINDAESKLLIYEDDTKEAVNKARVDLSTVYNYINIDDNNKDSYYFYDLLDQQPTTEPAIEIDSNDTSIVMYTSGTTGEPKGVVHAHQNQILQNWGVMYEMDLSPDDVGLSVAPLYHSAELHAFFLPRVHSGSATVIQHAFEPEMTLELIEDYGVTITFAAPTMWNKLTQVYEDGVDVASLRAGIYAGSSMAPAAVNTTIETFDCELVNYYGMTELGPCATVSFSDQQKEKPGCAGRAVLNHEVRIVEFEDGQGGSPEQTVDKTDVGELIIYGPTIMKKYWNKPDQTAESIRQGWYYTGDLAHRDEDGDIWIVDRADDMIISGGENIYPREVENVLMEHSNVTECSVIGVPDEEWGEKVYAYIIPSGDVTEEDLEDFCKSSDKLADFKRPRHYELVKELPTTASGKIQKYALRERHSDETESPQG